MPRRFRIWVHTGNHIVGIIGGIASVVIAIYAVLIQQQLSTAEQERGRRELAISQENTAVNRAIALYENFVSSDAYNKLMDFGLSVEYDMQKQLQGEADLQDLEEYVAGKVNDREDEFYRLMSILFQKLDTITRCDIEVTETTKICDKTTVISLVGSSIVDLFFSLRPALYCDSLFAFAGAGRDDFTSVVGDYLRDVKNKGNNDFDVYDSRNEVTAEGKEERDYIVIEYGAKSKDHCYSYTQMRDDGG